MQVELKEKLENLDEKFSTELDIISLKALCLVPENGEIKFAINELLKRLKEKYPNEKEIQELIPKKSIFSLEELIKILDETYPNNMEVATLKVLLNIPDEEVREKAIKSSLERLLKETSNDETIMEYLGIEKMISKEKNPNMIFVEGGTYKPSFFEEERTVFNLYVGKYQITQIEWEENMNLNPSIFKGERRPVENINWIQALEFCNKLSEKYNLKPTYKIENNKLVRIIYQNGEEVYPDLADFSKTEGYRLPTELEWEWFAFGGKNVVENKTFDKGNDSSKGLTDKNKYSMIAWYGLPSSYSFTYGVGLKKPNELGLYDVLGNVWEMLYDTKTDGYIDEKRLYIFNETDERRIRGGFYSSSDQACLYTDRSAVRGASASTGFRIVRTANPKR